MDLQKKVHDNIGKRFAASSAIFLSFIVAFEIAIIISNTSNSNEKKHLFDLNIQLSKVRMDKEMIVSEKSPGHFGGCLQGRKVVEGRFFLRELRGGVSTQSSRSRSRQDYLAQLSQS